MTEPKILLSLSEIKDRARDFSKRHKDNKKENAESQTFLNEFFEVFGLDRKKYAFYEQSVKGEEIGGTKRIDCLVPELLLIEMKSAGVSLDDAIVQAKGYVARMLKENKKPPIYILVSNFQQFVLVDLKANNTKPIKFNIADFEQHIEDFDFLNLANNMLKEIPEIDLNMQASKLLAQLHDGLKDRGYTGHRLQVFMTRLLFLLFAEDTGIYRERLFTDFVANFPLSGLGLGAELNDLFNWLARDEQTRKMSQKQKQAKFADFKYTNGGLFSETIDSPVFDSELYAHLLNCCYFYWRNIDPAIFGALFQGLEDTTDRRKGGQHYTSQTNILKVLNPLFLDALNDRLAKIKIMSGKEQRDSLIALMADIRKLTVLDPACGSGNFLIVAYRELRLLELEIFKLQVSLSASQDGFGFDVIPMVSLNNFYGIEINEWPAQIANVAMIITQHQMNLAFVDAKVGTKEPELLPLSQQANIVNANAMTQDWHKIIAAEQLNYIVGNPPFVGKNFRTPKQDADFERIATSVPNPELLRLYKSLDYVTLWFVKSILLMHKNDNIRAALVSTNSITQGEQVGALWQWVLAQGIHIQFAHRTFQWMNEDKGSGMAAVHCVIVGFGKENIQHKRLFVYDNIKGEPEEIKSTNINPYLLDAPNLVVTARSTPVCPVPEMVNGSKPTDGGHLLLNQAEKVELISKEPRAEKYIRSFVGAEEFINNTPRYCLWLVDCPPNELCAMPLVLKRVEAVKQMRLASTKVATQKDASKPELFAEIRQPKAGNYLIVPKVTSENRFYAPIAFFSAEIITSDRNQTIPDATLFHFGVVTSAMHMAWMRATCGRMKSDYNYSAKLVYNTFPWPLPKSTHKKAIETAAQSVLDVRAKYPDHSLAQLYNPKDDKGGGMPDDLLAAHQSLDKAVDAAYGFKPKKVDVEAQRVAFLFDLYEKLVANKTGETGEKASSEVAEN